jgi:hypothetical protein
LFARICGHFDQSGFSIQDAKIHTTRTGWALDTFQIVTHMLPQVAGAAEGEEGPAMGLRLVADGGDRTWTLEVDGVQVATGKGDVPSVERAMYLAGRVAAIYRAFDTTTEWSGPIRQNVSAALADAARHNQGCSDQGGYGSAIVALRDGNRIQTLDGQTIWPPHGRTSGAARWAQP